MYCSLSISFYKNDVFFFGFVMTSPYIIHIHGKVDTLLFICCSKQTQIVTFHANRNFCLRGKKAMSIKSTSKIIHFLQCQNSFGAVYKVNNFPVSVLR